MTPRRPIASSALVRWAPVGPLVLLAVGIATGCGSVTLRPTVLSLDTGISDQSFAPGSFVTVAPDGQLAEVLTPCADLWPAERLARIADFGDAAPRRWADLVGDAASQPSRSASDVAPDWLLGPDVKFAGVYRDRVDVNLGAGAHGTTLDVVGGGSGVSFQAWRVRHVDALSADESQRALSRCCVQHGCGEFFVRTAEAVDVYAYRYRARSVGASGEYFRTRGALRASRVASEVVRRQRYLYTLVAVPRRATAVAELCPVSDRTVTAPDAIVALDCAVDDLRVSVVGAPFHELDDGDVDRRTLVLTELQPGQRVRIDLAVDWAPLQPHAVTVDVVESSGVGGSVDAGLPAGALSRVTAPLHVVLPGGDDRVTVTPSSTGPVYVWSPLAPPFSPSRARAGGDAPPPCLRVADSDVCVRADALVSLPRGRLRRPCVEFPSLDRCVDTNALVDLLTAGPTR